MRVIPQLLSYAIALSTRTGIHLGKMKCVWFDEKDYFRFPALDAYIIFRKLQNHKILPNDIVDVIYVEHDARVARTSLSPIRLPTK